MKKDDWNDPQKPDGKSQTILQMHKDGEKALKDLGKEPSRTTSMFKKFQQEQNGQYVSMLLLFS